MYQRTIKAALNAQLTECTNKKMESQKENTTRQNDMLAYIGDNVRKVKCRMKKNLNMEFAK